MRTAVVVLAYRRPEHLRQCIESLMRNEEAKTLPITIYCDGWPIACDQEIAKNIDEVRSTAQALVGRFPNVHAVLRDSNLGITGQMLAAVDNALREHESAIVIEDDLVFSSSFLAFMLEALRTYRDEESIRQVSGYMWPDVGLEIGSPIFMRFGHYWGWGTWRRAWRKFREGYTAAQLLDLLQVPFRRSAFDSYSVFKRDASDVLKLYVDRVLDVWDIWLSAHIFMDGGYCLYSPQSLVRNHGFDSTGANCLPNERYSFSTQPIAEFESFRFPREIREFTEVSALHARVRRLLNA
jgi:hypothetical protein